MKGNTAHAMSKWRFWRMSKNLPGTQWEQTFQVDMRAQAFCVSNTIGC